jgi:RHS repeat-associated protein
MEEEYATDTFAVTTYQYDEIGHLTSFTDAENHTTSLTYGSLFGLTRITYSDLAYKDYGYDNIGNLISFIDANGNEITYTYDAMNRLTQIQYEDQSTVSFTYDVSSRRTRMDDNAPNTGDYVEYTYDCWNRVVTETRHISSNIYPLTYEYNEAGRLTSLTYPDGMEILYSYDDLNRTTEIRRYVDGINDEILMDNVQFTVESLLTQFDYGNDLQATFSYDSRDRPLTIDIRNGETSYFDFTFDNNSNIAQLVNGWRDTTSTWHSQTESYSYDGLDRLTSASCTSWSHTYTYDRVGNRTAKDSVTYSVNEVNEVTALSDGTSFTYDANGNRTQKTKGSDTWLYTYDYANRLTEVEKNSEVIEEYVYSGDSRRIQVTKDSVTTTNIYSGFSILFEESATGTAAYIYGPKGTLAKRTTINDETNTFYYHTDHLGTTRLVTDDNKNIVTAATYHPFGEPSSLEGSQDCFFTGKNQDTTGLYYYGARYYDPELGRFLTRDPKGGINQYSYCSNNPMKYVDPDGCEFTNWISDDYTFMPSDQVYKRHSHILQQMGITVESDPIWFGIYCIGAGIVMGAIGGWLGLSYIAPHLVSLSKTLFAAGPKVASAIMGALKSIMKSIGGFLRGLSLPDKRAVVTAIIGALLAIAAWILKKNKEINDPLEEAEMIHHYEGDMLIYTITIIHQGPGYERGLVTIFNNIGDSTDDVYYEYKYQEGRYFVLIDNKWVLMKKGWKPGDPIDPDSVT